MNSQCPVTPRGTVSDGLTAGPGVPVTPPTTTPLRTPQRGTPRTGNSNGGTHATGQCHTCDRPITGERRYCGPCAAYRDTKPGRRKAREESDDKEASRWQQPALAPVMGEPGET